MAKKPQIEKFREAARAVEADDSEEAFNEAVKKIVRGASPKRDDQPKPIKNGRSK